MKNIKELTLFCIVIIFLSCSKEENTVVKPDVFTKGYQDKTEISVTCFGYIYNGLETSIDDYGICWSEDTLPTIEDFSASGVLKNIQDYSINLTGLQPNKKYYYRAYAKNSAGIGYGGVFSFKTYPYNNTEISDNEGNVYHTIRIGNQVWFVENLKSTKFRNGDSLSRQTTDINIASFCINGNSSGLTSKYGYYYNQKTIYDKRNICPEGWHISTSSEWDTLLSNLGGISAAGLKIRESGSEHWLEGYENSTNEYGFTALPSGFFHYATQEFVGLGLEGNWWMYDYKPWIVNLMGADNSLNKQQVLFIDGDFYSIRCVQDPD